jgi:tRNA dimethylallyltransferase
MSASELPELLVVVGPTASGKSELALRLASRRHAEIVSADSVQVYRHFDIGTGKPSAAERAAVRHHLLDVVEPAETLDAARWAELADAALLDIWARGRTPIVCGGTFLWTRALLYGLAPAPPASPELRAEYARVAESEGRAALHARLAEVDPERATALAPNDFVRVSRALEVHALTGVTMSHWQIEHGFRTPRFRSTLIGVRRSREELDDLIRRRVEHMFAAGWLEEVRALMARGYGETRAMGSVGYKQIYGALSGGSALEHDALVTSIVRATRIFARRQRTWLREEPVRYVDIDGRELEAERR